MLFLNHTFVCLSSFSPLNHDIQGVLIHIMKVMHICELRTMVQTKDTLPNLHLIELSPDPLYIPDIGNHIYFGLDERKYLSDSKKNPYRYTYQC